MSRSRQPLEQIRRFAGLGADRLATELIELAAIDSFATRRCELLAAEGLPDKLAVVLRDHLKDLKRAAQAYRLQSDDNDFADRLEEIRAAIEYRVSPLDPALALDLLDEVFSLDSALMESCDEGWELGMVFDDVGKLWLQIAEGLTAEIDMLARIETLLRRDAYGVRSRLKME